nr:unnamed protein product [Callosobruchus chinensis]
MAASLLNALEAVTAWGFKNRVEFNASKTQYCTLSIKRFEQPGSAKKSLIQTFGSNTEDDLACTRFVDCNCCWENFGYLSRARKYSSPSNLLTLYKAQISPSLEYCSHIWGAAAPTTLSILDAVQRRAIRPIGDPTLSCHLQPLSHRRAVGDLSLFYRYSNGFCSSVLTSIIPPLLDPPALLLLLTPGRSFFIHQKPNDTTAPLSPGCPGPGMDCLVMYLLSWRVLAYSSLASTNFP